MSSYSLNINIDPASLKLIHENGSRLILAKSPSSISSSASVVWLTLNPLERNTITWVEDYSAYSPAGLTSAEVRAVEGFNEGELSGSDAPHHILSQDVVVNGEVMRGTLSPEAPSTLGPMDANSSNSEVIAVFIQEVTESGIIKDGKPLEISFDPNTAELTINYDPAAGGFVTNN